MSSQKVMAVNYTNKLCFKCLKESENVKTYHIFNRGFGSDFDSSDTKLQLCEHCDDDKLEMYFDEQPTINNYWEEYKYEEKINNFVSTLPIQGKELFNNTCMSSNYNIDPQDWIDMQLDVAPDDVYKNYGMYSPSERKAYNDRFPTCAHVYKYIYNDNSGHCKCKYGAHGNLDGSCSLNMSDECYYCNKYELKNKDHIIETEIEPVITSDEIKIVKLNQWTCKACGNINNTYKNKPFKCQKCKTIYTLKNAIDDESF